MRVVGTLRLPRSKWLEVRRQGLGGSDAAAVAGLDPWRSPLAVYLDKRNELPERQPSEPMEWGTALEPLVVAAFARRTGYAVRRCGYVIAHPDRPYVMANIDRLVTEGGRERSLLEAKTVSAYAADWEAGPPERVRVQCLHYLAVTGFDHAWAAALIGGQRLVWHRVERDDRAIAALLAIEERFWHGHVLAGVPPAASPPDVDLLTALHPRQTEARTVLPPEAADLIAAYRAASTAIREAEAARDAAKARLLQLLGDAEAGYLAGSRVCTWRVVERPEHVVPASAARVFRLTREAE